MKIGNIITGIEAYDKVASFKNEAEEIIAEALKKGEEVPTIFNLFTEVYDATHLGLDEPLPEGHLGFQRAADRDRNYIDITITYKGVRIATISQSRNGDAVLATPGDFEVIKAKEPLTWAICALLLNEVLAYYTDSYYAGDNTVLDYIGEEFEGIDEDGSKNYTQYYFPVTDTAVWVYEDPRKNKENQ